MSVNTPKLLGEYLYSNFLNSKQLGEVNSLSIFKNASKDYIEKKISLKEFSAICTDLFYELNKPNELIINWDYEFSRLLEALTEFDYEKENDIETYNKLNNSLLDYIAKLAKR